MSKKRYKTTSRKKGGIGFKAGKFAAENCIICGSFFSKARGLMFRRRNFKTPLLFVFDRPGKYAVHSFFCRKFLAVWRLRGRIVDAKIVKPWRIAVTPKAKFDELLEIPLPTTRKRKI